MTTTDLPEEAVAQHTKLWFSTVDYAIFFLMMGLSVLIGIYYGFFAKQKQNNTAEYLLGSRQMKVFPVAMSLTATHISAITMIGVPAEVFRFGTQYWACAISGLIVTIFMVYVFLPVFFELQTTSCYAYLEQRFDKNVRTFASFLFMLSCFLNCSVIIYTPAIAFSQVSGIELHIVTPVICCICIFYTTVGGIRAVVWTDTVQFGAMVVALIVVIFIGTFRLGGLGSVFNIADVGERLIWFNMDPDPTIRSSFWMVSIGLTAMWTSNVGVTPECVQRFLTVPDLSSAKKAVWIFGFGFVIVRLLSIYNGLLVFGEYHDCDPIRAGLVQKYDQIFPYYVLQVAQNVPGLPGLIVVGIFSAALSTLSTSMNTLSGTIYDDFIRARFKMSEKAASNVVKVMVVIVGVICLALVFVVEKMGSVFMLGIAMAGVTAGTLLSIFALGMFSPKINATGALWGAVLSLTTMCFIAGGAQLQILQGNLSYQSLPLHYDGCPGFNSTGTETSTFHIVSGDHDNSQVPWIFRLGFMYYSLLGTTIGIVAGIVISYLTGGQKEPIPEYLLTPWVRHLYKAVRSVDDYEFKAPKNFKDDFRQEEKIYK